MSLKMLVPSLPVITPLAARWVESQEAAILRTGEPLTEPQIADARAAGVRQPEKIRLKFVDLVPLPAQRLLGELAKRAGFLGSNTAGLTLNYGIYIRSDYKNDRELCVHECVHVGQYERFGSIDAFLRAYLKECLDPGYPWGPLEQEAIHQAGRVVRGE